MQHGCWRERALVTMKTFVHFDTWAVSVSVPIDFPTSGSIVTDRGELYTFM